MDDEIVRVYDPYEELANAIILRAVKDYRRALAHGNNATNNTYSIERFFKSEYFKILTDVDGQFLINKIKAEFNK